MQGTSLSSKFFFCLLGYIYLPRNRAIFHLLGFAPAPEDEDLYKEAHKDPNAYMLEADPAVIGETQLYKEEASTEKSGPVEELQDSSDESDGEVEGSDVGEEGDTSKGMSGGEKLKPKKTLTVPERMSYLFNVSRHVAYIDIFQLHAVIIDIVQSESKHKCMWQLIHQVCEE